MMLLSFKSRTRPLLKLKQQAARSLGTYLLEVQVALLGGLVVLSSHLATLHIVKLLGEAAIVESEPGSCRLDCTADQRRHRHKPQGVQRLRPQAKQGAQPSAQAAQPQRQSCMTGTDLHDDIILLQGGAGKEALQHVLGASSVAGLQQVGWSAQLVCRVISGNSKLSVKCSVGVAMSDA